jgi:hypothetical protein
VSVYFLAIINNTNGAITTKVIIIFFLFNHRCGLEEIEETEEIEEIDGFEEIDVFDENDRFGENDLTDLAADLNVLPFLIYDNCNYLKKQNK